MGHIKIPAQNRFTKCSTCVLLTSAMRDIKTTPEEIEMLTAVRSRHNEEQSAERAYRAMHKNKAVALPHKCLYIAVDGMDSSKAVLPALRPRPKDAAETDCFCEPHVTGVLTTAGPARVFLTPEMFAGDSNLTITCLSKTLTPLKLPPKIYVHVRHFLRVARLCPILSNICVNPRITSPAHCHCFWSLSTCLSLHVLQS